MTGPLDIERIEHDVAALHRGRRWLVVSDAAAGTTRTVARLREHGAQAVMVVAGTEGAGELPDADRVHYTRTRGDTMMGGIRASIRSVEEPSDDLLAAVDAFDPTGEAMVLGAGFSRLGRLAGRAVYGARPPAWGALEDKTLVDDIWDEAAIATAPSEVAHLADAPRVWNDLASDDGTVWVADNTTGWHGGGEYTRRVRSSREAREAAAWFAPHAESVRVMPFLDGIPCSIHGFVTDDGVAVFRPVELYILRRSDEPTFYYARLGTFWDPPAAVRAEMRSAARAVGGVLERRHRYRGGFSIDGVCTRDGFRPTELNPRLSVGLGLQAHAAEIPLGDIERGLIEGDLQVASTALEEAIVSSADEHRRGSFMFTGPSDLGSEDVSFRLRDDGTAEVAGDGEESDGTLTAGPAPFGSVVMASLRAESVDVGPSTAPLALPLMQLTREVWHAELPDVTAAPDLCA